MSTFGQLKIGNEVLARTRGPDAEERIPTELSSPAEVSPAATEKLGPGLIYRPLGGHAGSGHWTPGEICFQQLSPVGTHGAVVTQEVTSAACISGWDGHWVMPPPAVPPWAPPWTGRSSALVGG
ncbi:MAG: hypothetical protein IPK67_20710 [Planctomycetes bacterium]|nr:hypothetical protein [Planctomycetota bacterium]